MAATTEENEKSNDVEKVMEEVELDCGGEICQLIKSMIAFRAACPLITKDATNPFFHKDYLSIDAILAIVNPLLAEFGLMVHQFTIKRSDDLVLVTCVYHENGSHLVPMIYPLYPEKEGDSQKTGAALTYARRQSLKTVLCIGAADDDDAESTQQRRTNKPSNGDQQPGRDKTQSKAEDGSDGQASDKDKGTKLAISTRILGKEIGIEDIKVFLGLETSKSLTQEEWSKLNKDFKKYKSAASWFSAQITKDISEIGEFAAHRAGDWPMLYPDIKKAKDALEKGKDESLRDELWAEFANWNKTKDTESVDEDVADLAGIKGNYKALIDRRKGWETPAKRVAEEAKLSDKPYAEWGMDEHLAAIKILTDNDASDAAFEKF